MYAGTSKAAAVPERSQEDQQELWQPNEEIITEFALSILSQWVRKGKLDVANDPHTRSRVAPLLPKLAVGVGLHSTACAQLCLKCLAGLVPAGLPGMAAAAQEASRPVWKLLSNRQRLDSPLSQVLLHSTAVCSMTLRELNATFWACMHACMRIQAVPVVLDRIEAQFQMVFFRSQDME